MTSERSHAALRGGPTLIYLIPEALLHLHLTPNTHCTTPTCACERACERARAFYLGRGVLEFVCFVFLYGQKKPVYMYVWGEGRAVALET